MPSAASRPLGFPRVRLERLLTGQYALYVDDRLVSRSWWPVTRLLLSQLGDVMLCTRHRAPRAYEMVVGDRVDSVRARARPTCSWLLF